MKLRSVIKILFMSLILLCIGVNDSYALYDEYAYKRGCGYNSIGPATNPANWDQCIGLPEGIGNGSACEKAAASAGIKCASWGNSPVYIGYRNSKGEPVCKFFCTGDSDRNFVISYTPAPVNGQCGSANGSSYVNAPTSGLCNSGSASSPYANGPYWTWTCAGTNGGSTASCYANKTAAPINGQCGSANGSSYVNAPTSGLCNSGNASSPYASGSYWRWSCTGSNGGSTASCSANKTASPVNGQCGPVHTGTYLTLPGAGLCVGESPVSISGSGPWTWICPGSNGGANASCYANKTATPINGICGSAQGGSYVNAPTSGLCHSGTPGTPYVSGSFWAWTCTGSSGGSSTSCTANKTSSAVNGQCGSANGGSYVNAPTSGLCNSGSASSPYASGSYWRWTCSGANGGSSASCSANKTASPVNASCGSANGGSYVNAPTSGLCNSGNASSPYASGSYWYWTCSGANGGSSASCSAVKTFTPSSSVNGQCGPAKGNFYSTAPTSGLCNYGNASNPLDNGASWNWTCFGLNGGSSVSCSANKVVAPPSEIRGQCGYANGGTFSSKPDSGLCGSGTASTPYSSGSRWYWTCIGAYGGASASCSANKTASPLNASCGSANGGSYVNAPASGLCNSGSASSPFDNGSSWVWTCSGSNGGSSASCSASKAAAPLNACCGPANGGTFSTAPTSGLCSIGNPSSVYGYGPWTWTCSGTNGGSSVTCSANKLNIVNGRCGSSDGGTFSSKPTWGLCLAGDATDVRLDGDNWIWGCRGSNEGTDASCSASKTPDKVNAECGGSHGGTFTEKPVIDLCSIGTPSPVYGSGPWTWTCRGEAGGRSISCSASAAKVTNGQCGIAHGKTYTVEPISGLCTKGTATMVVETASGTWTWACKGGDGGSDDHCTAYKKTVNSRPTVDAGSDLEIEAGERSIAINAAASDPDGDALTYSWRCSNGTLSNWAALETVFTAPATINYSTIYTCTITVSDGRGGTASDSVNIRITLQKIDGECGDMNGQAVDSKPTIDLCNAGNATTVTGNNPWYWNCKGLNGGSSASCSVTRTNKNPEIEMVGVREVNERQRIVLRADASDPDGDTLNYLWTCSGGGLSNSRTAMPYYTAPSLNNFNNTYTCILTVSDNYGGSATETVSIVVRSYATGVNRPPVIELSEDREVNAGQSISLGNNTATDPDGDTLRYSWRCTGGSLSSSTMLNPIFKAPNNLSTTQTYTCTLTASDLKGGTASEVMMIVVRPGTAVRNSLPVVYTARDKEINPGQSVQLIAVAYDPDGDPITYNWSCNGGSLSDHMNHTTMFTPYHGSTAKSFSCRVTISDLKSSVTASVTIRVRNETSTTISNPVVYAGGNKELNPGQTIIFNPTASDPAGGYLTYSWSCNQGTLSNPNIMNPSYTAPHYGGGVVTCTLTVKNDKGRTANDSFTVKIREQVQYPYYYQY